MSEINKGNIRRAYSIKEVAEVSSLSVPFVRLEIKRGKLRSGKFGRRVLITAENLTRYLNEGEKL